MQGEQRYQSLWKDHLFNQAVAYFLFAFLFLRAYSLAGDDKSHTFDIPGIVSLPFFEFPGLVPLVFSFACLGLSVFLGVAAFLPKVRGSALFEEFFEWLYFVFGAAFLSSFLITWLEGVSPLLTNQSPLASVFFYAGYFWFLILALYWLVSMRKSSKKSKEAGYSSPQA